MIFIGKTKPFFTKKLAPSVDTPRAFVNCRIKLFSSLYFLSCAWDQKGNVYSLNHNNSHVVYGTAL